MARLRNSTLSQIPQSDIPVPRSSISSSSVSAISCDMDASTYDDARSSTTELDVEDDPDMVIVKVEDESSSVSTSPSVPTLVASESPKSLDLSADTKPLVAEVAGKRKRGRPRKNAAASSPPKIKSKTFVRSKTGCITCRRRKKKCDERRPGCFNCQNTGCLCEGYIEPQEWQPGVKQKKELARRYSNLRPGPNSTYTAFEDEIDRILFHHYHNQLSPILSVKGGQPNNNPFLSLIVPLAMEHAVVMHSLLGLSGAHLTRSSKREDYVRCMERHSSEALTQLRAGVTEAISSNSDVSQGIVACMILQYLLHIINGSYDGEYKTHYLAARKYIKFRSYQPIGRFAQEFFEYADMSITMTSLVRSSSPTIGSSSNEPLCNEPPSTGPVRFAVPDVVSNYDGIMLSVLSGLYRDIARITELRDQVRDRKRKGLQPSVEYTMIVEGARLDERLSTWDSSKYEDPADRVMAELYREAALVYLHRTFRASQPDDGLSQRVRRGIELLDASTETRLVVNCVLLLPTFIFSCAAFHKDEREKIREIFTRLLASNDFGNVDPALRLAQRVWEMMDDGDESSWDWETIKDELPMDFPIT